MKVKILIRLAANKDLKEEEIMPQDAELLKGSARTSSDPEPLNQTPHNLMQNRDREARSSSGAHLAIQQWPRETGRTLSDCDNNSREGKEPSASQKSTPKMDLENRKEQRLRPQQHQKEQRLRPQQHQQRLQWS